MGYHEHEIAEMMDFDYEGIRGADPGGMPIVLLCLAVGIVLIGAAILFG